MFKLGNFIDDIIGELETDTITTIYGPPATGKSTLCFQYLIQCLESNKKVIYVDTEGGFSVERIKQINPNTNLKNIIVVSPKSFEKQQEAIVNLNKQIKNSKSIGLVIVDSLVMLYRLKLGDAPQKINASLGEQLRLLAEISRSFHIPVLVTNQMYTHFDTKKKKMVGGNVIEYWSKTIVELDKENDTKTATLIKHKTKRGTEPVNYEIEREGLVESKGRSFGLFR